jgi:hypothetical protein
VIGLVAVAVFDAGAFAEEGVGFVEKEGRFTFDLLLGQIEIQGFVGAVIDAAACLGGDLGKLGFLLGGEGSLALFSFVGGEICGSHPSRPATPTTKTCRREPRLRGMDGAPEFVVAC